MNHSGRRFVDTHTHHQPFSHDAGQTLAELLQTASDSGLAGVMFSDHYDVDTVPPGQPQDIFDLAEAYREWQEEALPAGEKLGIKTYFGIEIGYQPHLLELCRALAASDRFDGVILSIHMINSLDPFFDVEFYEAGKIATYARYLDSLSEIVAAVPGNAIAGHYDYMVRYAPYEDPEIYYEEMPKEFDSFFQTLIESKKCWEINIRSHYRRRRGKLAGSGTQGQHQALYTPDPLLLEPRFQVAGYYFPDPRLIRRYLEMGGKMVSLASDAHSGEAGNGFPLIAEYLAACGLKEVTHFEKGQPVFTPLITPPKAMAPSS